MTLCCEKSLEESLIQYSLFIMSNFANMRDDFKLKAKWTLRFQG